MAMSTSPNDTSTALPLDATDAAAVPEDIKLWMLAQVGHWYQNREAVGDSNLKPLPYVDSLLDPWRIWRA